MIGLTRLSVSISEWERTLMSGYFRPILLKKSLRDFFPRTSVTDVEIWFAQNQKEKLSWFLCGNAKIE